VFSIKAHGARSAPDKSVLRLLLFLWFNLAANLLTLRLLHSFGQFSDCFPANDLNGINVLNEWNVLSFFMVC